MAIINCPSCGASMFNRLAECPYCAYPIKRHRRLKPQVELAKLTNTSSERAIQLPSATPFLIAFIAWVGVTQANRRAGLPDIPFLIIAPLILTISVVGYLFLGWLCYFVEENIENILALVMVGMVVFVGLMLLLGLLLEIGKVMQWLSAFWSLFAN